MKSIITVLLLMSFGNSAFATCLFGDHLIQTARMKDLTFSNEKTIKFDLNVTSKDVKQIKNGTEANSFRAAIKNTDDGEFWVRTITDTAHGKTYKVYLYSAGDNIVGFFVDNETDGVVAKVGDGSVYKCKVYYKNYDALRWFYTN